MKKMDLSKVLMVTAIFAFTACTDLEVEEKDSIVTESESGEFAGVDAAATLTSAYNDLTILGDQAREYALTTVTSDEMLVPTRGTDWGDNGVWRTLHEHTWDATHRDVVDSWNDLNQRVFRLNQLLDPATGANVSQTAEGKFLRAFYMYMILDFYGKIPFRAATDGVDVDPIVLEAPEAFDFIIKDLEEALPNLAVVTANSIASQNKASKASANFLLAKMYLNKHIFISPDRNSPGAPQAADMNKVIQYVDAIEADGYTLQNGYFDIFKQTADSETIFWTPSGVGNRMWNGLHYKQGTADNTGGGWNGFSTTADFYALFEGSATSNEPGNGQEERRGFVPNTPTTTGIGYGFLFGQQYDKNGNPLTDRPGNPLVFTTEFSASGIVGNNERTGVRVIKYHPENGGFTNHYILFRYADAYLMKIEAILRGGTPSGASALDLYNGLRTIRSASTAASVSLDDILDERGRELYIEGWRRNDQIRFGVYTSTWPLKSNTETFRVLFPIPAQAISSNPNLTQNPGY